MKSLILLTIVCYLASIALAEKKPALTFDKVIIGKLEQPHNCVVFTNDGKYIVAGDLVGVVSLYNVEQRRIVHQFSTRFPYTILTLRVTPNSRYIVAFHNFGLITVWDIELRQLHFKVHTNKLEGLYATNLAVTPDSKFIIATSAGRWIYVFNIETKALVQSVMSDQVDLYAQIEITADNKYVITSDYQTGIIVQKLYSFTEVHILSDKSGPFKYDNGVRSLVLTSDSKFAITGQDDKAIRIWNIVSGELVHVIKDAHNETITGLTLTSDNKFLISFTFHNLRIWNLETKELLHHQDGANSQSYFMQASISPDNKRVVIATVGVDRLVTLYDLNVYSTAQKTLELEELEELENEFESLIN